MGWKYTLNMLKQQWICSQTIMGESAGGALPCIEWKTGSSCWCIWSKMMDWSIYFTSLDGRTVAGRELLELAFGHVLPGLKLISDDCFKNCTWVTWTCIWPCIARIKVNIRWLFQKLHFLISFTELSSFSANFRWLSSWEQLSHLKALILGFISHCSATDPVSWHRHNSVHPSEHWWFVIDFNSFSKTRNYFFKREQLWHSETRNTPSLVTKLGEAS